MPIGETISDQKLRSRLSAQALSVATILQEEWAANSGALRTKDVLAPSLLHRIARIRRNRNLDPVSLGVIVRNEAVQARNGDLRYLSWFTREAEFCLTRHPLGLHRYLTKQQTALPRERRVALLFFGISLAKDRTERGKLVSLLASGFLDGKPLGQEGGVATATQVLTECQRLVLGRLKDLADAYFAQETAGPIRPRLFPLVSGPTGSGKTFLCRKTAEEFGAEFLTYTIGDWIPLGAQADYEATLYSILGKIAKHDRVVLCLDEIDKVRLESDGTWGRSVASDIWRALDLNFPVAAFLKSPKATLMSVDISEAQLSARVATCLWIVGAGTWQFLHEARPSMGFQSLIPQKSVRVDGSAIARSATIPTELLMRFHPDVLHTVYPTREETALIFRESGLAVAAAEVGLELQPDLHDWTRGGMRSLETIWGEVAILRRKKNAKAFL